MDTIKSHQQHFSKFYLTRITRMYVYFNTYYKNFNSCRTMVRKFSSYNVFIIHEDGNGWRYRDVELLLLDRH